MARRGVAAELELDVGQVHVQEQGRADPAGVTVLEIWILDQSLELSLASRAEASLSL